MQLKTNGKRSFLNSVSFGIAAACAVVALPATAQNYPNQTIKLIVPFTAGGGTDVTARLVAEQLAPRLGQAVIVENRPGASAALGAGVVANSAPNGYTLLVGSATLASSSVIPGTHLGFDLINDFEFIGKIGQIDLIVVVTSKLGVDDLRGLVNLMRTKPDKVQFGSPGTGAPAHLGGELFKQLTKTDALHIPYKGESAALTDLYGGQLTFQLCAVPVCTSRIQDGTLKGLAIAAKQRSKIVPTIPTTAEAGVPGLESNTWWYLAAPKGTPQQVITRLNAALNEVFADAKFRTRLEAAGVEVEPGTTPASVKTGLLGEMNKWRPVVQAAGIKNN